MPGYDKVIRGGEEYVIVPICTMTGYPRRYTDGASERERAFLQDNVCNVLGRSIYDQAERCGALKRTDTVDEQGGTIIECEVQVLVKARTWEEVVRGDPERNPPCTHDT